MKRGVDRGFLIGDLDANHFSIRNLSSIDDPNLVYSDDPRLGDPRVPNTGSVTDESILVDAGIPQSKLSLTSTMPPAYIGMESDKAAPGDVTLYKSTKNAPFGYGGLGVEGKLPTGSVSGLGSGSVTDIHFDFPETEFNVEEMVTGTDRGFQVYWASQNPFSFFGNMSGSSAAPSFQSQTFSLALVPNIDASKITSGILPPNRLPPASGVGVGHAPGMITISSNDQAQENDYLARDQTFKRMETPLTYQPQLPAPSISLQSYFDKTAYINITLSISTATLFYQVLSSVGFLEVLPDTLPLLVDPGITVKAYAALAGYTNSEIVSYQVQPISGQ